jgi:nucleoid-associated protein YgaU
VPLCRWIGTTAVMAAVAWALRSLGPGIAEVHAALGDPQGLVDRNGVDALLLVAVSGLAWACWAWGTLGLLLSAASTVPGWAGRLAGLLLAGVLPAGARRAAALALGLSLSTAAPVLLVPAGLPAAVATAAAADDPGGNPGKVLVDWPTAPARDVVPDWPSTPPATPDWPQAAHADHVVVRGDCLWDLAADWLQQQGPAAPVTDVEVQRAVRAWWQVNAAVIGRDPDLLLPGQVLRPPG